MGPVYAHCPHCTYPVVVISGEERAGRYCRQCRRLFVPAESLEGAGAEPSGGRLRRSGKHRMTWGTLLKRKTKPATDEHG